MVEHSATRCSCISILWVSLVTFAAITLCVASQRVFIVVSIYIIHSVRKLLDTPSHKCIAIVSQILLYHQRLNTNITIIIILWMKRPPGRPSRRWEDNIRMDLKGTGWEDVYLIHVAQYMVQWRTLLKTIMNLRDTWKRSFFTSFSGTLLHGSGIHNYISTSERESNISH
jgi:hypothetical protein